MRRTARSIRKHKERDFWDDRPRGEHARPHHWNLGCYDGKKCIWCYDPRMSPQERRRGGKGELRNWRAEYEGAEQFRQ